MKFEDFIHVEVSLNLYVSVPKVDQVKINHYPVPPSHWVVRPVPFVVDAILILAMYPMFSI